MTSIRWCSAATSPGANSLALPMSHVVFPVPAWPITTATCPISGPPDMAGGEDLGPARLCINGPPGVLRLFSEGYRGKIMEELARPVAASQSGKRFPHQILPKLAVLFGSGVDKGVLQTAQGPVGGTGQECAQGASWCSERWFKNPSRETLRGCAVAVTNEL